MNAKENPGGVSPWGPDGVVWPDAYFHLASIKKTGQLSKDVTRHFSFIAQGLAEVHENFNLTLTLRGEVALVLAKEAYKNV